MNVVGKKVKLGTWNPCSLSSTGVELTIKLSYCFHIAPFTSIWPKEFRKLFLLRHWSYRILPLGWRIALITLLILPCKIYFILLFYWERPYTVTACIIPKMFVFKSTIMVFLHFDNYGFLKQLFLPFKKLKKSCRCSPPQKKCFASRAFKFTYIARLD